VECQGIRNSRLSLNCKGLNHLRESVENRDVKLPKLDVAGSSPVARSDTSKATATS